MSATVAVIILTFNEEKHIERCIKSIRDLADEIFVVDSYSEDNTVEIAKSLGAKVLQNKFINQAVQFNWALNNCDIKSQWILRIDADEYVMYDEEFCLRKYLSKFSEEVKGLYIKRKIIFMRKLLHYGGWNPQWSLRIFRYGYGKCEDRWMDEHIILKEGIAKKSDIKFVDENLNDLSWWTSKHNHYATREALQYFIDKEKKQSKESIVSAFSAKEGIKKSRFKNTYYKLPPFFRPFLNFIYRYFFQLGFLDGKAGFIWHVLQGFWYRFLVDAKIYELKKRFNGDHRQIIHYIRDTHEFNENKKS